MSLCVYIQHVCVDIVQKLCGVQHAKRGAAGVCETQLRCACMSVYVCMCVCVLGRWCRASVVRVGTRDLCRGGWFMAIQLGSCLKCADVGTASRSASCRGVWVSLAAGLYGYLRWQAANPTVYCRSAVGSLVCFHCNLHGVCSMYVGRTCRPRIVCSNSRYNQQGTTVCFFGGLPGWVQSGIPARNTLAPLVYYFMCLYVQQEPCLWSALS